MMFHSYDENLQENEMFVNLQSKYKHLLQKAITEHWVVCVPCADSLNGIVIDDKFICQHILIPNDELPRTHFNTLNNDKVTLHDGHLKIYSTTVSNIPILFSEKFYADDGIGHSKLICIEMPFGFKNKPTGEKNFNLYPVQSADDCRSLIDMECKDVSVLMKMECILCGFKERKKYFLSSTDTARKRVIRHLYNMCMKTITADANLGMKTNRNNFLYRNLKLSVETVMLNSLHGILWTTFCTDFTPQISHFNKIVANLSHIQISSLEAKHSSKENLSSALKELSNIEFFHSVLEKISCLKRAIILALHSESDVSEKMDENSTDKIIPILAILLVESGICTWPSQLAFMRDLHFSGVGEKMSEYNYLIASLEAAICSIIKMQIFNSENGFEGEVKTFYFQTNNPKVYKLFNHIYKGDDVEIDNFFKEDSKFDQSDKFCHPLCTCQRCEVSRTNQKLNSKFDINCADDAGNTPLHLACIFGKENVADKLLLLGADPNLRNIYGAIPLHYAMKLGHQSVALLLMYANGTVDIHPRDLDGNTPLHLACAGGHDECVKAFLYTVEHSGIGIDINVANKDGNIALHIASELYHATIVECLLRYGAFPDAKNNFGKCPPELNDSLLILRLFETPFDKVDLTATNNKIYVSKEVDLYSSENKRLLEVKSTIPIEFGVKMHALEYKRAIVDLFDAIKKNDLCLVKHFLGFTDAAIARVSEKNKCHPLCQCDDCVDLEDGQNFDLDVELNINVCDDAGYTPLHIAVKYVRKDAIKWLLEIGVKPNLRTFEKLQTPLHLACAEGSLDIVKLLLKTPTVDVNCQDAYLCTPLHYACSSNRIAIVEELLKQEPDIRLKNSSGKTPINEAHDNKAFDIVRRLKSFNCNARVNIENTIAGFNDQLRI